MFTPIQIQYYGTISRTGGRRTVSKTVDVSCVWDTSARYAGNPRFVADGVEVKCIILFEDITSVDPIEPKKCRILYGNDYYEIIAAVPPPPDLGLEVTYELLLKRMEDQGT